MITVLLYLHSLTPERQLAHLLNIFKMLLAVMTAAKQLFLKSSSTLGTPRSLEAKTRMRGRITSARKQIMTSKDLENGRSF
jgi:hypothetical protein